MSRAAVPFKIDVERSLIVPNSSAAVESQPGGARTHFQLESEDFRPTRGLGLELGSSNVSTLVDVATFVTQIQIYEGNIELVMKSFGILQLTSVFKDSLPNL